MKKEENKLIAEFMGIHEIMLDEYSNYEIDDIYQILGIKPHHHKGLIIHESDLQFNTSWDWLMPVVEEIDHLEYESERLDNIEIAIKTRQIRAVHKAVVEFIKWYNENK